MDTTNKFSEEQLEVYQNLIRPDSNWPTDLRQRFQERCRDTNGYHPNLDHEVISEYVQEKFA